MISTLRFPTLDKTWLLALGLLGVQLVAAASFFVDLRLPFIVFAAVCGVVIGFERPLAGVALLIAGRLTSTGATAWFRLGKVNIDLFEVSLMLAVAALTAHAAMHKKKVALDLPWQSPVIGFLLFQFLTLGWTRNFGECVKGILATCILLATTMVILQFSRRWEDLRLLLFVWIAASLFVSLASLTGLTDSSSNAFQMAAGSRAGGFGQQPNWFAMNLMYGVMMCVALALIEKNAILRLFFFGASLVVFFAQMTSGSRGGTAAIFIGAGIAALFEPRIRRIIMWTVPIVALVVFVVIFFDLGDASNAFGRVFSESSGQVLGKSVRVSNWTVCLEMFRDTWGLGIGGGGYEDLLPKYDYWLSNSQYTYPHGIFWGMVAHFGVIGLLLYAWFIAMVGKMSLQMLQWTGDARWKEASDMRVIALCMLGTLIGYWAWSFAEFNYDDKPFWEFLGLFTALWWVIRERRAEVDMAATAPAPKPPPTPEIPPLDPGILEPAR
jgi:O-antigen ligase